MRRVRLGLFSFLGFLVSVLATCDSPEPKGLLEPSFGKVNLVDCGLQSAVTTIETLAATVYRNAPNSTINSVDSHVENIAREVCADDTEQAIERAWSALWQIDQQVGDLVLTGEVDGNELWGLWDMIFKLACTRDEAQCIYLPEGTFLASGGIGSISKRGGSVLSKNGEAALVAEAGDFSTTDDVIVILARIPKGLLDQGLAPKYSFFEEGYQVVGTAAANPYGPNGGVVIQMCVHEFDDNGDPVLPGDLDPGDLWLGHVTGTNPGEVFGTGVEDLPRIPLEDLIITEACAYVEATAQAATAPSGWLQSVGRFAASTLQKVFGPEPLRARRGPGVGLGGRAGTFSPFVPVYPYQPLMVGFSGNGFGEVQFYDSEGNDTRCPSELTCPIEYFPVGAQVELVAFKDEGSRFAGWTGDCVVNSADPTKCTVTMDKDGVGVIAAFEKATTPLIVDVTNLGTAPLTVSFLEYPVGELTGTLLKSCSVGVDETDPAGFDGCDVPEVLIGAKVVLTATPVGVTGPWDMAFIGGCSQYQSMKGEGSVSCTIPVLPGNPETISILFTH